jgi:hypothetical protein
MNKYSGWADYEGVRLALVNSDVECPRRPQHSLVETGKLNIVSTSA